MIPRNSPPGFDGAGITVAVIVGGPHIRPEGACSGPGSASLGRRNGVQAPESRCQCHGPGDKACGLRAEVTMEAICSRAVLIGGRYVLTVRGQGPGS